MVPNILIFLHPLKSGPILQLFLSGRPKECIQGKISTMEDFCGIPDLKTELEKRFENLSSMSKRLLKFSIFLHISH